MDKRFIIKDKKKQTFSIFQLVQIIRESEDEVTFLLVSKEEDAYFKENNILITAALLDAVINGNCYRKKIRYFVVLLLEVSRFYPT